MASATVKSNPSAAPARLRGPPLVGQLGDFRRRPLELLERCSQAPGAVVELRIRTRTYVLKSPGDIRHVLVTNPDAYEKPPRIVGPRGGRVGGRGVFFSPSGAEHRRGRAALRPSFARGAVAALGEEMVANADRALESWLRPRSIDLEREADQLAFRTMLRGVFGTSPEETPALAEGILVRRHYLERTVRALLPRPRYALVSVSPARRRKLARLDDALDALLRRKRNGAGPQASLLAGIARSGGDGKPAADREMRDQLLTIGITGFSSVGAALTWTVYELARHPAVGTRLATEVDDALGDAPPGHRDLGRLPYASAVVSEALRLYPPSWMFMRMTRADDELPSGARLRAGAKVILSPYLVQRSAAHYQRPERFDPDRFAPEPAAQRPRFAYFPFGGGRRVCVGREFALLQLTLATARLAQRAGLELLSGEAALDPYLSLRPREPIRIRVTPR